MELPPINGQSYRHCHHAPMAYEEAVAFVGRLGAREAIAWLNR
jgi:hypothetical protein